MAERLVVSGGTVVLPGRANSAAADISVVAGRIEAIGADLPLENAQVLDATGRTVVPGFVDAHSHADAAIFDEEVQRALLRQGVTTVIIGQDGVSFAPGDGEYASRYFGAINGRHPMYRGGGVADLLSTYEGTTPINVGYLLPAGTIRWNALQAQTGAASERDLATMRDAVEGGLVDGALGLSTGFDYVPNAYQRIDEISELCRPVAAAGGVHVSHVRGGYEQFADIGIREATEAAYRSGVRTHVAHLHGPTDFLVGLLSESAARGVELSFDAYPYRRGCTLLSMLVLPPELVVAVNGAPADKFRLISAVRRCVTEQVERGFLALDWPTQVTLAHVGAADWAWAEGATVATVAQRASLDPIELCGILLSSADMQVNAIVRVPTKRTVDELTRLHMHAGHCAGSDGIFIGSHPHPRARGTFARYIRRYVRELGLWDWPEAVAHLATRAAATYGLTGIGRIEVGAHADLAVIEPGKVRERSNYAEPLRHAEGVVDVLVSGVPVLRNGEMTGRRPGRVLRRT